MFDTKRRCADPKVYKSFSFEKIYNSNNKDSCSNSNSSNNYINEYVYRPSTKSGV